MISSSDPNMSASSPPSPDIASSSRRLQSSCGRGGEGPGLGPSGLSESCVWISESYGNHRGTPVLADCPLYHVARTILPVLPRGRCIASGICALWPLAMPGRARPGPAGGSFKLVCPPGRAGPLTRRRVRAVGVVRSVFCLVPASGRGLSASLATGPWQRPGRSQAPG